jgi:hypothetical protein
MEYRMNRLALAAAGAAVLGLTACGGHSAAPGTASHVTPLSCKQQYRSWTHGHGKEVMHALDGVSTAATKGDGKALTAALRQAKPAVAVATRHPIPACADPRGYWDVVLMHVNAAAAGKGAASGARAALRDVPKIHTQLLAEVKKAAR